jgi:rubrerythrin
MGEMTDAEVLEACRKIELRMAKLYDLLADLHAAHEKVRKLWAKTAREEDNHAQQFALLLRRPDGLPGLRVDGSKAEQALKAVDTIIASYHEKAPSVHEALEAAMTLEHTLAKYHADYAVEFTDEGQRQLFRAMMAADNDHVGALQAALGSHRKG